MSETNDEKVIDIKDLSDQEIIDMDLEELAYLFLLDFCEHNRDVPLDKSMTILGYTQYATSNTAQTNVKCAVYEAYQWLCNKGYIMEYMSIGQGQHFVTRAGKDFLKKKEM